MNKEQESFRIVLDDDETVAKFVCNGLYNGDTFWLGEHFTLGFMLNGQLIGGLIYHDIRKGTDVWWTIYTTDKRWCNKRTLRCIFGIAFDVLKCRRISLLIGKENKECLGFVQKLGFKSEGKLRGYQEDGQDSFIFGLLKEECHFVKG